MKLSIFGLTLLFLIAASQEIVPDVLYAEKEETYQAVGTLNLTCLAGGVASAPFNIQSTLFSTGSTPSVVGTYNGTFAHNDGSFTRVVGPIRSTPNAGTLSNFLSAALRTTGGGELNEIQLITRYGATGGAFNSSTPCTDADVGTNYTVNFSAIYGFYESRFNLPTTIAGFREKEDLRAVGTLQLTCTGVGTVGPITNIVSTLFDGSTAVGTYNGNFTHNDGSTTRTSGIIQSFDFTGNTSLTYFLANAVNTPGTGLLNGISYITRYDTVGGVFPPSSCTDSNIGQVNTVPFEASYNFYTSTSSGAGSASGTGTNRTNSASVKSIAVSLIIFIAFLLFL